MFLSQGKAINIYAKHEMNIVVMDNLPEQYAIQTHYLIKKSLLSLLGLYFYSIFTFSY